MKLKITVLSLMACLCVTRIAVCMAGDLERIRSAAEKITSIKGVFIQEKQMPILAKPLVARGYFAYQRPNSLRWEYREPLHSVLLLYKGNVHRYTKSENGWQEERTANLQSMDFILQEIANWLNGRFDENPMFKVDSLTVERIVMTPKDKSMDQFIKRIELVMSDQPGVMKAVIIYESDTSFTRFTFIDPSINSAIPPEAFQKIE